MMKIVSNFTHKEIFPNNELFAFCYTDPEVNGIEHTHEFDELVIVDKGYGVQVFNGELYFIQEGDVFLVKEGDHHFYSELGTLKLLSIQINTRYEFHYLKDIKEILNQFYIKSISDFSWLLPEQKDKIIALVRTLKNHPYDEMEVRIFQTEALFMQILSSIMAGKNTAASNLTQYKIRNLLVYLQQHYMEQIDWQVLSEQFFLTYKTMMRKIKELTGLSPVNYLNRLRVLSARQQLCHSDDSVTDIAGICGFNNSDYFTKCYKKNFGVSPSDERRNAI